MFPLNQVDEITEWSGPISAELRVRILLALQPVNKSAAFSDACAEAIAASPDWQELVSELLGTTRTGPHVVATAVKILRYRAPNHGIVELPADQLHAARICDAIDDGTALRVSPASWFDLGEGACWLVGLEDPVNQCVRAVASADSSGILIVPEQANWLERSRLACPAFIAVTA